MKHLTTADRLKRISIRGRVAFGINCLEVYFSHLNLQESDLVKELCEKLWEFVASHSLDKWEVEIKEYLPCCILDNHPDNQFENYTYLKEHQLLAYRNLYLSLPDTLVEMIDRVAEIGLGNLYGETGDYSARTLAETACIIRLMGKKGLVLPELSRFERSYYSESHGWGNAVDKQFFAA